MFRRSSARPRPVNGTTLCALRQHRSNSMLDVTHEHPFTASVAFAVRWLGAISRYDLAAAEALIDVNDSGIPFEQSFPAPEGFTYAPPEASGWSVWFGGTGREGFAMPRHSSMRLLDG